MKCKGGTKTTRVEHSAILSASDCMLHDGQNETLDHSFTNKTTDFWTGQVKVKEIPVRPVNEIPASQGIFFNSERSDTFPVYPIPATDYILGAILRSAKNSLLVERPVEFRASDRTALGNGAAVEVVADWALGSRSERGSFRVSFMVGS